MLEGLREEARNPLADLIDYEVAAYGHPLSPEQRALELARLEESPRTSYLGAHLGDVQADYYAKLLRASLGLDEVSTSQ